MARPLTQAKAARLRRERVVRGIRGATTAEANSEAAILEATSELLQALLSANEVVEDDIAGIFFSLTPDLNAAFPAKAARQLGLTRSALLCMQEISVPGAPGNCIRILAMVNTRRSLDQISHVYLRGAQVLRPERSVDA